jgi:hypothetical protein
LERAHAPPPEKWLHEQVRLSYWTGDGRSNVEGSLDYLSNFGVTVFSKEETRFFPWHAVLEISLMSERRPRRAVGR